MKKIYHNIAIVVQIVLFLSLISCTKNEALVYDSGIIQFDVQFFTTKATASTFEPGDIIGVYVTQHNGTSAVPLQISGNYANNSALTFNGSKWTANPAIFWSDGKFDIYAYYPFMEPTSIEYCSFSVSLDQSTPKSYGKLNGYEASDFLWASKKGISKMDVVPLIFSHRMSKIVINLVKGDDFSGEIPDDAVVKIHSTVTDALVDLSTGLVTKDPYKSINTITSRKVANNAYDAIIVPQRINSRQPLIEVIMKDVSYLVESSFNFRPGTQHTVNIILNSNPEKVKITIGGEIIGWN